MDGQTAQHFSESLTYNAQTGNVDQIAREFGTFTFQHDLLDQLKSVAYSGASALPYSLTNRTLVFDAAGNRIRDSLNGAGTFLANNLLSDTKTTIAVDNGGLGRLVQKAYSLTGPIQKFGYFVDGKLSHFESGLTSCYPQHWRMKFSASKPRTGKTLPHSEG
jgi:hypothetical protein